MTEATHRLHMRGQLAAIAGLRWRMFVNSLRTKRGKMELVSRGLVTLAFTLGGLGGAVGMAGGAWYLVSNGKAEGLAAMLWPVFFFWQVFPVMATAFTNNPDSSDLLRFPLSYRSYFLIRLAYGSFDPAVALGSLWLFGMLCGISFASLALMPWALLVLATFAAFNLVFMQMVLAWVERWLAQRRTREVMGVLFILLMLSFQLIGPAMGRIQGRPGPGVRRAVEIVTQAQSVLPPGLAADAIAQTSHAAFWVGFSSWLLLSAMMMTIAYVLHLRLRAQYRGESLSETAARGATEKDRGLHPGWNLPGISQAMAAVFEKEVRYLSRSGPMLLTLIMPVFMLVIFRFGPMNSAMRGGGFLKRTPDMAFPMAAAYALLVLTNLVYNSFGGDGGGIQFFYASPVHFRQIVLAKNLAHAGILALNTALAWIAVSYFYGRPEFSITVATLAALLFAAPLNFTVGNLLSIYSPKKLDFAAFGRQRVSQLTVLISLGVQLVIGGLGAATFFLARWYGSFWIAALAFGGVSVITLSAYVVILNRVDGLALERRETLVAELCRA
jgi:ABC-2 type transport system permease protein